MPSNNMPIKIKVVTPTEGQPLTPLYLARKDKALALKVGQIRVHRVTGAAAFRVHLEQPVDGFGLEPGGFGHALGGTARRGTQQQAHALRA